MRLLLLLSPLVLIWISCQKPTLEDRLKAQMIASPTQKSEFEHNQILEYAIRHQLDVQSNPSGLFYVIESPGEGSDTITPNSVITFYYDCYHLDGFKCGSSKESGQATQLNLGAKGVIEGWREGIPMLKKGGKGKFLIPSRLGYGTQNAGHFFPPNTILVYDIEVVDYGSKTTLAQRQNALEENTILEYIAKKGWEMKKTPSGIYYKIDHTGSGAYPTLQSKVKLNYQGSFLDDYVFQSFPKEGQEVDLSTAMSFWQQTVPLLRKGEKGVFIIPSALAFGNREIANIPANSIIVAEFELLDWK